MLAQQNGRYQDALHDLEAYMALSPRDYLQETQHLMDVLRSLVLADDDQD